MYNEIKIIDNAISAFIDIVGFSKKTDLLIKNKEIKKLKDVLGDFHKIILEKISLVKEKVIFHQIQGDGFLIVFKSEEVKSSWDIINEIYRELKKWSDKYNVYFKISISIGRELKLKIPNSKTPVFMGGNVNKTKKIMEKVTETNAIFFETDIFHLHKNLKCNGKNLGIKTNNDTYKCEY